MAGTMNAKTIAEAKADIETLLDAAVDYHEPVVITHPGKAPVVLISLAEWNSWTTTLDLTRDPTANARLREASANLNNGGGIEVTVDQLDAIVADHSKPQAAE